MARRSSLPKIQTTQFHQAFELKLNWDILPDDAHGSSGTIFCWLDFLLDKGAAIC